MKALTDLWLKDESLRRQFWEQPGSEYRATVVEAFSNYSRWVKNLPVPTLPGNQGVLPGDFSATFTKGQISLGIVGLNSTLFQLSGGDFRGKLDIHVSQLNAVCGGAPDEWFRRQTASVLLTHQPPNWLAPHALQHFRQEIHPAGRFLSHLCGHQHEPMSSDLSEGGAAPRRLRQAPSLFGLEQWGGETPKQRLHGYTAGQFEFDGNEGNETLWPRTGILGIHGGLNLCPDHRFKLSTSDCYVNQFDLTYDQSTSLQIGDAAPMPMSPGTSCPPAPVSALQPLNEAPDEAASRDRLSSCPRFSVKVEKQHKAIRHDEQAQFEHQLRTNSIIWLAVDWGTGVDGFLGASIARFSVQGEIPDTFHLKCDDANDIDSLLALFQQQFGMSLQAFGGFAATVKNAFIILDGIYPSLCTGEVFPKLLRIVQAIADYCPSIKVVIISSVMPEMKAINVLRLKPLEIPDVRTYLQNHPDAPISMHEADVIELLHERTDGLPMFLDRILKALRVSSLALVLDAELDKSAAVSAPVDTVPKSLIHAVSTLAIPGDAKKQRSFRLLKVPSVLPYGETLEALKRYFPTEPFFIENALELSELALLEIVPLQNASPYLSTGAIEAAERNVPKIVKVPRQVRDYTLSLLSDGEWEEILSAGIERFFGRKWREGKVKMRTVPLEYKEYLSTGPGNEFAVLHHLIARSRSRDDYGAMRRAVRLGCHYCHQLMGTDRFRDVVSVAGGILKTIERDDMPEQWSDLAKLLGQGLRMIGKTDDGLKYLRAALDAGGDSLSSEAKSMIWLNIALAHERTDKTAAVQAAEEVQKHSKPSSTVYLQAMGIIVGLKNNGAERLTKLREFERQSRVLGHHTLADSISLDLAHEEIDLTEKLGLLNRVLKSSNTEYNQSRALIAKALVLREMGDGKQLEAAEVTALSNAYAYLHSQRFDKLFNKAHEALWGVLESSREEGPLFRLFRHSSFLWRIRGDDGRETKYLRLLAGVQEKVQTRSSLMNTLEVVYFTKRTKAIFVNPSSTSVG